MNRLLKLHFYQWIILVATLVAAFALVYAPHYSYRFPFHVDEWHHIAEGLRLGDYGAYFEMLRVNDAQRFSGMEIGFHFFIFLLSFITDVVLAYRFLPALWAMLSAVVVFFVAHRLSGNRFFVGWLAVIFFAAIKSNVNVTGLWFFTPLTFAIPFVYLYTYLLHRAFERQSPRLVVAAFAAMIFLTPIHSISVLFFLPTLVIFMAVRWRFVFRAWYVFVSFLAIPIVGLVFYKFVLHLSWVEVAGHLFRQLQFRYGWGVLELQNPLPDLYPLVGIAFAVIGFGALVYRGEWRRLGLFLLWPLTVALSLIIYRMIGISFLSPYQRNLYYFTLALPLLSAFGLAATYDYVRAQVADVFEPFRKFLLVRPEMSVVLAGICVAVVLVSSFVGYYAIPARVSLYHVIEENDYRALKSLSGERPRKVMAPPLLAMAVYPLTRAEPVGAVAFYGDVQTTLSFFRSRTCKHRQDVLAGVKADYVFTHDYFDCRPQLIYNKDYVYVYRVR